MLKFIEANFVNVEYLISENSTRQINLKQCHLKTKQQKIGESTSSRRTKLLKTPLNVVGQMGQHQVNIK